MPEPAIILPEGTHEPAEGEIIKLAMLAVGGQGGGVLADWIVDAAERSGYLAQSTSVAGVAQRTGATIYYIEMCRDTGRRPVFALSPAQGDVAKLTRRLDAKLGEAWVKNARWITDLDQAKAEAKRRGVQIFGYFTRSYAP